MFPTAIVGELIQACAAYAVINRGGGGTVIEQAIDVEAGLRAHKDFAIRDGWYAKFDEALDAIPTRVLLTSVELIVQIGCIVGTQCSRASRSAVGAAAQWWAVDPYDARGWDRTVAGQMVLCR